MKYSYSKDFRARMFFCKPKCFRAYKSTNAIQKEIACARCGKIRMISGKDIANNQNGQFFCSHSCRAMVQNKLGLQRTPDNGKPSNCIDCKEQISISKYADHKTALCNKCKENKTKTDKPKTDKPKIDKPNPPRKLIPKETACIGHNCTNMIPYTSGRVSYCEICLPIARTAAGLKAAAANSTNKRSKNEKLFADTIIEALPTTHITTNEQFFADKNGNHWDADIILHDLKIAIHWNGNWHYQYCGGKHSLAQVQSRDKIKWGLVENAGYINYIIEDRGKFSEAKVNEEVHKFLNYIGHLGPPWLNCTTPSAL